MRRRLRSAALPVHRHSIPQLAIDGVLVAAAYYLAYRFRFDQGLPHKYRELLQDTFPWVVVISLVVFALFRLVGKLVLVRRMGRVRRSAKGSHAVTGLFLVAAGVEYLRETPWVVSFVTWLHTVL